MGRPALPYNARALGLHGAHQAVGEGSRLHVALGGVVQRARPAACGMVLEPYGVGPACGQLLRADDCGGPARVVVGIAHAVAVDVARFQRYAPTAVVVGGRGVAVGVLHARHQLVQHAVVGVFVAHALTLVVGGLGERGQVAVRVVRHVVHRGQLPVVHGDAGDVALAVHFRRTFAVHPARLVLHGNVPRQSHDVAFAQFVVGDVRAQLVVGGRLLVGCQVAVGVVGVVYGGAHAALPCVVVDRLPDGDERGEHACAVVALPYRLVGVEGSLQFVALRIVQRFGGDEVVHVQVAVVAVLGHLRAVGGIVLLGVQLSGDDLGEPEEVSFAPVAIAAFILELVAHARRPVLGISARSLHGRHHPAAAGHGEAGQRLAVLHTDMSAERQGNAAQQVGAAGEVAANDKGIGACTFNKVGQAVAINVE